MPLSDLEIARATKLRPIESVASGLGIPESALYRYGPVKAKVDLGWLERQPENPDSKLVLVTAISPTPAGEGKTTTSIGLADGLRRLGMKAALALREPSLGPCFGVKGGATGGGRAQIAPMEEINLHFTGDFHAITAAHNLMAALVDNHLYWGNALGLDESAIAWKRVMDMNDRALRRITLGPEGRGPARESGFDITVASETMAVFCLAESASDLMARLERMVVGRAKNGEWIRAEAFKGVGGMAALLKDALHPNLVQTLEGAPAFVHGGPFANIAHGCNSVIATRAARRLADIVVTEAGFGADLGAEKFLNIKCRSAKLVPGAVVVVATLRALKMHGGVAKADLARADAAAVTRGLPNLKRHLDNMARFGVRCVVAVNRFAGDTPAEFDALASACREWGVEAISCAHWADGGEGALELARKVREMAREKTEFRLLYPDHMPLEEKIKTVATRIYGAAEVAFSETARAKLAQYEKDGFGAFPVCMSKTQYSFSADPERMGAPEGFTLPVRDVRLSAGAGFVVALTGDIMTMPGLPRTPAAERIGLDDDGEIYGIF